MGRGKMVWNWIFEEFRLPRDYYIVFPEQAEVVDVVEVERELLTVAAKRVEFPLNEAKSVLHWAPTSKTYKAVKCALEERGWVWCRGKSERKLRVPQR